MMKNKGIICVNKPKDWTSFDVVNRIKHIVKPNKVGHLGTLDPMATGVLLVTVGKATKLFDLMQQKEKTYIAKFQFGYETDTLDATGKVVNTTKNIPTIADIKEILPNFIGKIDQIPPKYSAKSINGKRAYELARNNQEFELKSKLVTIYDLKIIDYTDDTLTLEISCGSGTYIRSIGRDLAYKLSSLATMTSLVRTKISKFNIDECVNIEALNIDNIDKYIMEIDKVLDCPILELNEFEMAKILNGQILDINLKDGLYKLNNKFDTLAIVKINNFKAKMEIFLG